MLASSSSMLARLACARSSKRGRASGVSADVRMSRPRRSSMRWASAEMVRWAAVVVSRLAIAARARATARGLPAMSRSIG